MKRLAIAAVIPVLAVALVGVACTRSEPLHDQATTSEAQTGAASELHRLALAVSAGRAAQILQTHARWIKADFFLGTCAFENGFPNEFGSVDVGVDCGDSRDGGPYAGYTVNLTDGTVAGFGGDYAQALLECAGYDACTGLTMLFWTSHPLHPCQTTFPKAEAWQNCFPTGLDAELAHAPRAAVASAWPSSRWQPVRQEAGQRAERVAGCQHDD